MWFVPMREKKILARAIEIQKESGGNHAFFRDIKKALKYKTKLKLNYL